MKPTTSVFWSVSLFVVLGLICPSITLAENGIEPDIAVQPVEGFRPLPTFPSASDNKLSAGKSGTTPSSLDGSFDSVSSYKNIYQDSSSDLPAVIGPLDGQTEVRGADIPFSRYSNPGMVGPTYSPSFSYPGLSGMSGTTGLFGPRPGSMGLGTVGSTSPGSMLSSQKGVYGYPAGVPGTPFG